MKSALEQNTFHTTVTSSLSLGDSGPGPADCVVKPPGLHQGQERQTGRSGMEATVALPCATCGCRRGPCSRHPGPALTCAPAVCSHYSYNTSLGPLSAPLLIKLSSMSFFFFNFGCAGSSLQHTGASLVAAHKLLFSSLCSGVHRLSLCSA